MGRLRRLGGWGSPGESLIGTLWEKRNELVCCSRGMGTRGNLTRRRSVGVSSFSAAPFRRSMRTGQMYMREMMCCAGPSARALMLLALSFGAITSSVALLPPNGQAFVSPRAGAGLVLVGAFVDDYLFASDSLPGLEVPEDGYTVTDMLYNVNKCEVSSDMCLSSSSVVSNEWQPILAQVGMTLLLRARSPSAAMLSLFVHSLPGVRAVCTHCKDTITPTHLDAACPLVVGIAANAQLFATKSLAGSPTLTYSLTHEMAAHFTRPVVDAIMGIACAPCQGAQVDLKSGAYTQHHAVVKAAVYGHASFAEASAELAERMDTATTDIEVNKIRGALDSLKLGVESAIHTSSGVLAFCWAKISSILSKRNDPTFKLEVGKGKTASHTATLVRPKNEAEFYEMIHLFIMLMVALGMASATIVSKFLDDVVYGAIRMKESWKVAHELLMLYFREIDLDPLRLMHMGNVYRRGGQDTLLSEARRNAAAFFRAGGGILQLDGAFDTIKDTKVIKPSGEGDEHNKRPCSDYNAGRPCKKLKPDGSCVFAHKCNQFVSDKGPNGYCFGDHVRPDCKYDDAKKLKAPAK